MEILRHSLGLNYKKKPFRNFYADEPDDPVLGSLVDRGLMKKGRTIPGGLQYYHVTEMGQEFVMIAQKTPRAGY